MTLDEKEEKLRGVGIEVGNLAIASMVTDTIIGSVTDPSEFAEYGTVEMTYPLKFMRIQQMTPNGVEVRFAVTDFDFVSEKGARIYVKPTIFYMLRDQPDPTRHMIYDLIAEYLTQKQAARAAEAGLVIPERGVKPVAGVIRGR